MMLYLFKAYCVPDYGLQVWDNATIYSNHIFKTFETAYARAMKRIKTYTFHASSHVVANQCYLLLLKHHMALIQTRYFKSVFRKNLAIFILNKNLFLNGRCFRSFLKFFLKMTSNRCFRL